MCVHPRKESHAFCSGVHLFVQETLTSFSRPTRLGVCTRHRPQGPRGLQREPVSELQAQATTRVSALPVTSPGFQDKFSHSSKPQFLYLHKGNKVRLFFKIIGRIQREFRSTIPCLSFLGARCVFRIQNIWGGILEIDDGRNTTYVISLQHDRSRALKSGAF